MTKLPNLLNSRSRLSSRHGVVFAAVPLVVGAVLLVNAMAAGSFVAFEAESGSLAGGATATTVAGASGGQALKFGTGGALPGGAITHGEQVSLTTVGPNEPSVRR